MSGMHNGHISSEADGETLQQRFTHLFLGQNSSANAMTEEDICPVCKNSTYLQKNLRFKINTKCYHRICEGCVDRITSTQKKCPIAGCTFAARGIIPRRTDYRVQTFADLAIEREVDIRKRVMAILNRREDEFESKRAWDDFLEQREEMVMNLVLKTDVKKSEAALNKYKEANADVIKTNAAADRHEAAASQKDGRYGKAYNEKSSFGALPAGRPNTSATSARGGIVDDDGDGPISDPTGLVKGLRRIRAPPPQKVYDPFMGMPTKRDYYELRADYPSIRLAKARNDARTQAGGFDFESYFDESLLRAFAGFGCFLDEEKADGAEATLAGLAGVVGSAARSDRMDDELF